MEEKIIKTEYSEVMQKSFIDYAMSVIIARALPDVRDGLKPVQRRILLRAEVQRVGPLLQLLGVRHSAQKRCKQPT